MNYLLKLGPVQLESALTNVYLRVGDRGDVAPPAFQTVDVEGVKELIAGLDPQTVRCEAALSDAAAQLNLTVERVPPLALDSRAAIAVFMVWGHRGLAQVGSDLALMLMQAAGDYLTGRPWAHWPDTSALELQVTGSIQRTYEASLFGNANQGYGLALYEEKGAIQKVMELQASGRSQMALHLPAIGVMLDDKPAYAVAALEAAGRQARIPIPLRGGGQGPTAPTREECVALIAALKAASMLDPTTRDVRSQASADGIDVEVRMVAPLPRLLH